MLKLTTRSNQSFMVDKAKIISFSHTYDDNSLMGIVKLANNKESKVLILELNEESSRMLLQIFKNQ